MSDTINLGVTPVAVGTQQFLIDGLPGNSVGFELIVGVGPTWTGAVGRLFNITLEIAIDGGPFQHWMGSGVDGGILRNKDGSERNFWSLSGTWPGESDGTQMGRRVLRASDLRFTLDVQQAFTATSVVFRTV